MESNQPKQSDTTRKEDEFLKTVLDSLPNPFYVINADDYTIRFANKAAFAYMSPIAKCYAITHGRMSPCSGHEHPCPLNDVKRTRQPVIVEHLHYDANGDLKKVEIHACPILDSDGNVTHIVEYYGMATRSAKDSQSFFRVIPPGARLQAERE